MAVSINILMMRKGDHPIGSPKPSRMTHKDFATRCNVVAGSPDLWSVGGSSNHYFMSSLVIPSMLGTHDYPLVGFAATAAVHQRMCTLNRSKAVELA